MKNLTLAALLAVSFSSLFAQKKTHDATLIFGKYIYTEKGTGKKWGAENSLVSDQWTVQDNREQLAFGELYLNNDTHDTLRNVVFYYVFKGIGDAMEVRTVDTVARIITAYKFADITGFHVGQVSVYDRHNDTGRFYSVSRKGINTITDGRMDIAQAVIGSSRFMLLQSIRLPASHAPFYYKFANMTAFANIPEFGEERIGPKFKNKFAKIFENCPAMKQMVKDKNYSEDRAGIIEAFKDYNALNCPDNAAAASN